MPEHEMRGVSLINLTGFKVRFTFEFRDFWIGLFVRRTDSWFHIYFCLVPLFPVYITVLRRVARKRKHSHEGGPPNGKAHHRSRPVSPVLRGRGR